MSEKIEKFAFVTRNFLGGAMVTYEVEACSVSSSAPKKPQVGHHVLVVDASGSMYGDIDHVKEKIRKMLTLDEYRNSSMLVSLLSYSSSGDLIRHFERVPVADIVASRHTKAQREIGSLRARGMTCASQAFAAALDLAEASANAKELTAISLHTDGYFNDPSPSSEFRAIDKLVERAKKIEGLFVNTVGYRDSCDFTAIAKIANALSGRCFQAGNVKTFYDSLYDASQVLSGQLAPAFTREIGGDCDYQVFVSSCGKVVGSAGNLAVRGVPAGADCALYRFRRVKETKVKQELPLRGMLAFARAQLADGRVAAAKYALCATRLSEPLRRHARALAAPDLAAFAAELDQLLADCSNLKPGDEYGFSPTASVLAILGELSRHRDGFLLDLPDFLAGYRRRGLKRVAGSWQSGKLVRPPVKFELREREALVPVSGFDFNRQNATVNMMVKQPCKLVKDGAEVSELAGIKLDLQDFKQYTLVGDGVATAPRLRVRLTSKRLHRALAEMNAVPDDFDPKAAVYIDLASRPVVDYAAQFDARAIADLGERLARLHAAAKLLGALGREVSAELSDAQVEELERHCVTPNLYASAPSAVPYTDLGQAIAAGEVDVRVAYRVLVGSVAFPDPSDIYSGNEFFRRFYDCGAADPKKATLAEWYKPSFKVERKKLSARVKIGPVDDLMAPIFDEFFGLSKDIGAWGQFLIDEDLAKFKKLTARSISGDDAVEAIADLRRSVGDLLDSEYRNKVAPLVFYVGASGLLPDDFGDVPALTADELLAKYPNADLGKKFKDEGAFYDLGGGAILTVVREQSYFSTERGVEAAKKLGEEAA